MSACVAGQRCFADADASGRFRGVLEPGERVLWAVQPRPFRIMRSKAAHALFGTVVVVMLTMTPMRALLSSPVQAAASGQGMPRTVIGATVLLCAAYSLLIPFAAFRRARRTWYAVTDRRVLRVQRGKLHSSAGLDEIAATFIRETGDGTGDILFSRIPAYGNDTSARHLRGVFGVPRAEEVHRTIHEARQVLSRSRENIVPDYLEFLLQGKRPEDLKDY